MVNAFAYDFSAMAPQPTTPARAGIVTVRRIVGEFGCWSQATAAGSVDVPVARSLAGFCIFLARLRPGDDLFIPGDTSLMCPFMEQQLQDDERILFQRTYYSRFIDDAGTDFLMLGDVGCITRAAGGDTHFDVRVARRYDASQFAIATGFAFAAGTAANHRVHLKARLLYSAEGHIG